MTAFNRYIGINYSGAETPDSGLATLRVCLAEGGAAPGEVPSPDRRHWSRSDIAEWLVNRLDEEVPTLIGINHAFSFPIPYFQKHGLAPDWPAFLDDFQHHWPTDGDYIYVDFIREALYGNAAARMGDSRWRRLCEERAGREKSVFDLNYPGSVAKATHAGLPWLRFIRRRLGARVHFWPFDGWKVPAGRSAIVEVYPALWRDNFPTAGRARHQHDAYCTAAFLSGADRMQALQMLLEPDLPSPEKVQAQIEGWILGVANERIGRRRKSAADRSSRREAAPPGKGPAITNTLIMLEKPGRDVGVHDALRCRDCGRDYRADVVQQGRCPLCRAKKPGLMH